MFIAQREQSRKPLLGVAQVQVAPQVGSGLTSYTWYADVKCKA